jgi:hypothetical protein
MARTARVTRGGEIVSRALRSNNFWLTIAYVGTILLIARAYA